ncbi:hypothetical protein GCM10022225_63580 [Plantactinospora mayteni]|uniref:WXG100 family type VII secretion target n=1 Tax=Plantactinospora mayteni TaxID=566021 RepID=A0ABQ4F071_9ACTN|nr:hypothetical protein [Plantactinospora mayteni]GIH00287.1 hypothetical protein Pma05_68590 [Plantactinospora mayteni]
MAGMTGDGIRMDIGATRAVMQVLSQVAATLRASWTDAEGAIESQVGQLGNDRMGREFRASFDPVVEELAVKLDLLIGKVERRGRTGHLAVDRYEITKAETEQVIRDVPQAGQS